MGFGLEQIAQMLASPDAGVDEHLRRQHRLLRERLSRMQALLEAIEYEMEARRMGISLSREEQFEIFGTEQLDEHMQEASESCTSRIPLQRAVGEDRAGLLAIRARRDPRQRGTVSLRGC